MSTKCCVNECGTVFRIGIHSHCLPLNNVRNQWLRLLKLKNIRQNDRICSKHFAESDYVRICKGDQFKEVLKPDALPSKNLPLNETDCANVSESGISDILDGFVVQFDPDVCEEERRFYTKLFPLVNLVLSNKAHCTSCNEHLGTAPSNAENIKMHPILKVTQCKKCHDFYNSGEFCKGEDGSELYCRWCGQGGEVYCCAKCPYVFCKICISENLSSSLVDDIRDNEHWCCFVCSPKIIWPIRAVHWALKNYIVKQKRFIIKNYTDIGEINHLMQRDLSTCCGTMVKKKCDDSDYVLKVAKSQRTQRNNKQIDESIGQVNVKSFPPITFKEIKSPQITLPTKGSVKLLPTYKPILPKPAITSISSHSDRQPSMGVNFSNTLGQMAIAKKTETQKLATTSQSFTTKSNNFQSPVATVQLNQSRVRVINLSNLKSKSEPTSVITRNSKNSNLPPPLFVPTPKITADISVRTKPPQSASVTISKSSQNPVYHTIAGFCIDLNSASKHNVVRLPNGKIIQVKKSTTSASPNQLGNKIISKAQNTNTTSVSNNTQAYFTISQPSTEKLLQKSPTKMPTQTMRQSTQEKQQLTSQSQPSGSNSNSTLQLLNANYGQSTTNVQQITSPKLTKYTFSNDSVGLARTQLQKQILTSMEICNHLAGKIHTLTNSNPYKNAKSISDVKELYIHLSYLFTYGIGRFKNLQEKCNDDMIDMGFKTVVSKLCKGQLAEEKYASDGDEDEIVIIEPKTTTIDLDSEDEEQNKINNCEIEKNLMSSQAKTIEDQPILPEENDYQLPLSLLAGMLDVELSENNELPRLNDLTNVVSKSPAKRVRKRINKRTETANKKNIHLYSELKKHDKKLKQNCSVVVTPIDLNDPIFKNALVLFMKNDTMELEKTTSFSENKNSTDSTDDLDEEMCAANLLEVTMDSGIDDITTENIRNENCIDNESNENTGSISQKSSETDSSEKIDNISGYLNENLEETSSDEANGAEKIAVTNEVSSGLRKCNENVENVENNMEFSDEIVNEEVSEKSKKNEENNSEATNDRNNYLENISSEEEEEKFEEKIKTSNRENNNDHNEKLNVENSQDVCMKSKSNDDYFENISTEDEEEVESPTMKRKLSIENENEIEESVTKKRSKIENCSQHNEFVESEEKSQENEGPTKPNSCTELRNTHLESISSDEAIVENDEQLKDKTEKTSSDNSSLNILESNFNDSLVHDENVKETNNRLTDKVELPQSEFDNLKNISQFVNDVEKCVANVERDILNAENQNDLIDKLLADTTIECLPDGDVDCYSTDYIESQLNITSNVTLTGINPKM